MVGGRLVRLQLACQLAPEGHGRLEVLVSKRHRRQTGRQHRKVFYVELPRGVLENAGAFGGSGKKALQVCGATGHPSAPRDIHGYGDK